MRKRQNTPQAVLARRGAEQEARKSANVLAKAIRLGRAPKGVVETTRGDCFGKIHRNKKTYTCQISGRRFRRTWFEAKGPGEKIGDICSTDPLCVLCMTRELGISQ